MLADSAFLELGEIVRSMTTIPFPDSSIPLIDYHVRVSDGEWFAWKERVPRIEVDVRNLAGSDVVIPTIDTGIITALFSLRCC